MARRESSNRSPLDKVVTRRKAVATGGAACTALALCSGSLLSPARAHASVFDDILALLGIAPQDGSETAGPSNLASSQGASQTGTARPMLLKDIQPVEQAETPSVPPYTIADDWSNVVNIGDWYLADPVLACLKSLGFAVLESGFNEYFEIYENNRYSLFPNFVTVDSLAHTYHLYFAHLLRNIERDYLSVSLTDMSRTLLATTTSQLEALRGTAWEAPARLVCAFFGVGASLLDSSTVVPEDVAEVVSNELALIGSASGITTSPLTGIDTDYTQFIVRGYYAGDPTLEPYFRAMIWYGGVNFTQSSEDLDRAALLTVLALDDQTRPLWEAIYTVTSFFAGASDDAGYFEYRPLVEEAYGGVPSAADLASDDAAWARFHELTAQLPAPAINSIPGLDVGQDVDHREENKGFRFMGQRFSIDAAIFQELIYNIVGENAAGERRMLPDVLDVPAGLGSDTALGILETQGDTAYEGYTEQMQALRDGMAQAPETLWTASLASQWLSMLRPLTEAKGEGYPMFMQGDAWARKDLQTFAGSYAELKHDTVLYAKQAMAEAGGGPIDPRDDRGYVEPEPDVFGRLASLVAATSSGLSSFGLLDQTDADNLAILQSLATQLQTIAQKELRNELPTEEEFELIRSYGAQLEHFWQEVCKDEAEDDLFTTRDFPAAIITDIATDPEGRVLQIGTGAVTTIYVVVPLDGTLRLASGGVYSFYQFAQPIDQRLTDTTWRQMLGIAPTDDGWYVDEPPSMVPWVDDFTMNWRDFS